MSDIDEIKRALRVQGERQIRKSRLARDRAAQMWGQVAPFAEVILSHAAQGVPFVIDEGVFGLLAATAHKHVNGPQLMEIACIERTLLGQSAVLASPYMCRPSGTPLH